MYTKGRQIFLANFNFKALVVLGVSEHAEFESDHHFGLQAST